MNIEKLIKDYGNYGIRLWLDEGKLRFKAPAGIMTEERKNDIRRYKEDIISYLSNNELSDTIVHNEKDRYSDFSLTPIQSSYVAGKTNAYEYGGIGCQIYIEANIGKINIGRLNDAWRKVVERHDMLRAVILQGGYQRVLREAEIPEITEKSVTESEYENEIKNIRKSMINKVYASDKWPLFDLCVVTLNGIGTLCFSMDMLVADSVSVGIIMKELLHYCSGGEELAPLEITYRDYITFREKRAVTPKYVELYQKDRKYWLDRIDNMPSAPNLSVRQDNEAYLNIEFINKRYIFSKEERENIRVLAAELGVTETCLLLSAYAEVLGRWSVNKKFTINVTTVKRENIHPQTKELVGDFTDVLLIEAEHGGEKNLKEKTLAIQEKMLEALEHSSFSGVDVIREIARKKGSSETFPYVFTSTLGVEHLDDEKVDIIYRTSRTSQVFIDAQAGIRNGGLEICWDVRKSAFRGDTINELFDAYISLIRKLISDKTVLDEVSAVQLPQKTVITRAKVNATEQDIPEKLLYSGFIANAEKTPDKTAIVIGDKNYTYGELYRYSCGAAEWLCGKGMKAGEKVAVSALKGVFQIASVLGTLMAGGVYVPMDVTQPAERMNAILESVGAGFAFLSYDISEKLGNISAEVCSSLMEADRFVPADTDTAAPAYIIFTSGSTGTPKGVVISHDSAMNTIQNIIEIFGVNADDKIIATANLAFDLSVFDIFGMLNAGGTIVIADDSKLCNAEYLCGTIRKNGITIWNSAPAQMEILVSVNSAVKNRLDTLRLVMLSGDWIPVGLADMIHKLSEKAEIYSLGGATEASIWSIYHKITPEDTKRVSIPYGKPLANQQFYILDSEMMEVPDGVIGDIYIAGRGLALEYFGDKELTDSKFIFHKGLNKRIYKTGDLGRYESDGKIEFIGRCDAQVKLNGHRVELGEIESAINSNENISSSAVVITGERDKEKKLFAFAVPENRTKKDYRYLSYALENYLNPIANSITEGIDGERFIEYMKNADSFTLIEIIVFFRNNNLFKDTDKYYTYEDVLRMTNTRPEYAKLVKRWLNALTEEGYLELNDNTEYRLTKIYSKNDANKLRDAVGNNKDFGSGLSLSYFDNSIAHLQDVLNGTTEPQEILFPKASTETAFNVYHDNIFSQCLNALAVKSVLKAVDTIISEHPNHKVRILEIGAGTGGTSDDILPHLDGKNVEYHFTDISAFFLNKAREKYKQYPWMVYHTFDINQDYKAQGIEEGFFDVIICANVLHMANNGDDAFKTMRTISNSEGFLIIIDGVKELGLLLTSMGFLYRLDATDDRAKKDLIFFELEHWYRNFANAGADLLYKYPKENHFLACSHQRIFISRFNGGKAVVSDSDIYDMLERKLPQYMIPSKVTVLSEMPITANGKTDRKKLLKIAAENSSGIRKKGAAAESALEKKVEKIWMETLNRDVEIGREANFFEIGGDSLLLAQTIGRIMDEVEEAKGIEWEDLMRMLLKNNTISLFCNALVNRNNTDSRKLIHIFSEGNGSSDEIIVFFSDGTGRMVIYNPLIGLLLENNCNKKLIGFNMAQYDAFLTDSDEDVIKNMAGQCAKELLKYSDKKLILVGHCYGGAVAFETAKILKKHNVNQKLVLIETKRYTQPINSELMLERGFSSLVQADFEKMECDVPDDVMYNVMKEYLSESGRSISDITDAEFADVVAGKTNSTYYGNVMSKSQDERLNQIFDAIPGNRNKHSTFEYKQFKNIYLTFRKSMSSIMAYSSDKYSGNVVSYIASSSLDNMFPVELENFDRVFIEGDIKEKHIEGTHIDCMNSKNVEVLLSELL